MKLSKEQLSKIIQEELQKIIQEENLEELDFKQMGQNLRTGAQAMGNAFKPSNVTAGLAQGLGGTAGKLAAGADALVRGQGKDQAKQNMANKAIANQRETLRTAISSLVKSNAPGAKELNDFFQQWFRKFPQQSSSYSGPMTEQDSE